MLKNQPSAFERVSVSTKLRRNAEILKKWATEAQGIKVDYDRDGVRWLGNHIDQTRNAVTTDSYAREVSLYGSFLGECLCRIYKGRWQYRNQSWVIHCTRGTKQLDVFVFDKVEKQIKNGPSDNVESYLEVLDFYLAAGLPVLDSKLFFS